MPLAHLFPSTNASTQSIPTYSNYGPNETHLDTYICSPRTTCRLTVGSAPVSEQVNTVPKLISNVSQTKIFFYITKKSLNYVAEWISDMYPSPLDETALPCLCATHTAFIWMAWLLQEREDRTSLHTLFATGSSYSASENHLPFV